MVVFAVNIHTGGGKILLDELIASEKFGEITHLYLDERYINKSIPRRIQIKSYPPTILDRLRAQKDLKNLINVESELAIKPVLFFGNLPPFFKLNCISILYLQNCFLLEGVSLPKDSLRTALRSLIERYLLKIFRSNYQQVWVQSDWMLKLTKKNFPEKKVLKMPFLPVLPPPRKIEKEYDLISVTSLSLHKNFNLLLDALSLLDLKLEKSIRVLIVLDNLVSLEDVILPPLKNIQIEVKSQLTREQLYLNYELSRLAVITSSLESFCLPLFESLHFGLKVICPSTGYTSEVRSITIQFDLKSVNSLKSCIEKNI